MKIKIGTRKSKLAMAQSTIVMNELKSFFPDVMFELVPIMTEGDERLDANLSEIGGKGLFLKAIEEQLIQAKIDMAVHSLKDMPAELPKELEITAILKREDSRDAFLSKKYSSIDELPANAVVGTSSTRRKSYLQFKRPDLVIVPFRGNIDSRIKKMLDGEVDATILACCGLKRINLTSHIKSYIPDLLPAVGQGAIAIETRIGDSSTRMMAMKLNHKNSHTQILAERAFLAGIEGDCTTPICVKSFIEDDVITITGQLYHKGHLFSHTEMAEISNCEILGKDIAKKLLLEKNKYNL